MKKLFLLCTFAMASFWTVAQTANAVVYSENGEKFTLYLNGEPKNATPQANVKIGGLVTEFYQARVDFEDPKLIDFSNNNFAVKPGLEVTYVIKVNNKGQYVLRYFTEGPKSFEGSPTVAATAPKPTAIDPETKKFAEADDAPAVKTQATVIESEGDNHTTGGTVTTTTTTTTKPANGENINVGMNIGGVSMGINMNVSGMDVEETENTTVTTKTTTTKSTTTTTAPRPAPTPTPAPAPAPVQEQVVVTGGCAVAMSGSAFTQAKGSISNRPFEEDKLKVAKQVTKANCLSTAQIKEVMSLYSFEESKLDYAKYAYDYCTDKGNYYLLNDAFSFETSVSELDEFLQSK